MKSEIVNLNDNFKPFGEGVSFKRMEFPSGCEPHVKLLEQPAKEVIITCRIHTMKDLMVLFLMVDALRRYKVEKIGVFIPYLPFARQDRIMVPGEPLSIKVLADLLNTQKFNKVFVLDVHSEVSLALIDNVVGIDNYFFVQEALKDKSDYLIVSPDAGAFKKIFKVCQNIGYTDEIILCNKVRDVSNGQIKSITVSATDLKGKDCYIIDDICDGGGTFIALAEQLKKCNSGKVNLIVTHGIFSKGIEAIEGIDHIYTTNSFTNLISHENLTVIPVCNIHI